MIIKIYCGGEGEGGGEEGGVLGRIVGFDFIHKIRITL